MVDTLVSGASASRHVGSSPIIRTKNGDRKISVSVFLFLSPPDLFVGRFVGSTESRLNGKSRLICFFDAIPF